MIADRRSPQILWLTALLLFTSAPVWAKKLPHYDLCSLVLLSDCIVLVERYETKAIRGPLHVTWCNVKKVYKGKIEQGAEFPMPNVDNYSLYPEPWPTWIRNPPEPRTWDPEAVLFLQGKVGRDGQTGAPYAVVPSGLRLISRGVLYKFVQGDNPGPYEPVLQDREFPDEEERLFNRSRTGVKLPDFEKDLGQALTRVKDFEKAKALPDPVARKEALLRLLGPPKPFWPLGRSPYWSDGFTPAVLKVLEIGGELDSLLEAVSRCKPGEYKGFPSRSWKASEIIAAAKNEDLPSHKRVAAVRLLGTFWLSREKETYQGGITLLKDRNAEVRAAAEIYLGQILKRSR